MRYRLKRWFDLPTLWPICFSILFNCDVADIDFDRNFELFSLLETFSSCKVVYPQVLPVITSMLGHGLKEILRHQDDPDSPLADRGNGQDRQDLTSLVVPTPVGSTRRRSMSLTKELESRRKYLAKSSLKYMLTLCRSTSAQERTAWWAGKLVAYCYTLPRRSAF